MLDNICCLVLIATTHNSATLCMTVLLPSARRKKINKSLSLPWCPLGWTVYHVENAIKLDVTYSVWHEVTRAEVLMKRNPLIFTSINDEGSASKLDKATALQCLSFVKDWQ